MLLRMMPSKILIAIRWILLLSVMAVLPACTRNVKKDSAGTGVAGTEEDIIAYELPSRGSMNPADADFDTLSSYSVLFDFDSFSIRPSERPKLESVAAWLNSNPRAKVVMAGHTDERGTTQYNLGLGERRALAARDYLLGLGIDISRISTISYGEERPARGGSGEATWSANRRVEVGVFN